MIPALPHVPWNMTPEQLQAYQAWAEAINASQQPTSSPVQTPGRETLPPHDQLDVDSWVRLVRELGYWDDPNEPVEEFWKRVAIWDEEFTSAQLRSSQGPLS